MTNGMFGLRVEFAAPGESLELRHQYYELRFRAFGHIEASDPVIGQEYDGCDARAPCVLIFDGDKPVAGVRLLLCEEGAITLDPLLVDQGVPHGELSRFVIDEDVKDRVRRKQINFLLCSVIAEYAFEERGYEALYCDARKFFYHQLVELMGEALETLGPEHDVLRPGRSVTLRPICIRRAAVPAIRERFIRLLATMQARGCKPEMALAA